MALTYPASTNASANMRRSVSTPRRVAFAAIAVFILLGPAPGQLFGAHSMLLREWIMFSGAGVGLLKGSFTLHRIDAVVTMSPLEVLALPSYLALPIDRRVYEPADLKTFAGRICNDTRETERLSFEGSVGTFSGWRTLTAEDICNAPRQAHFGDEHP
jgi:hypothetical protein